jgi:hypothetical protein
MMKPIDTLNNYFNRNIINGNPIYNDRFAPFQLKSWLLYFKQLILSNDLLWAHLDNPPWRNQIGNMFGEPLITCYLPNPYFTGINYNTGDPQFYNYGTLQKDVHVYWS